MKLWPKFDHEKSQEMRTINLILLLLSASLYSYNASAQPVILELWPDLCLIWMKASGF